MSKFIPYIGEEYEYHAVSDDEWWDSYFKWCEENLKDPEQELENLKYKIQTQLENKL